MRKLTCAIALAAVVVAVSGSAADVSYEPEGSGPYSWATDTNWDGGALPGTSDNAVLSDAKLVAEALVLGAGDVATVAGLYVGKSVAGNTTVGPYRLEIAGTLTNTAAAYIGYKAAKSEPNRSGMVTVKSGGEWVSQEQLYIGYGAGCGTLLVEADGKVVVTNGTTSSLYVGAGFASPGVVTNYGTIVVDRDLDIGNNISDNDNAYGEFHNYGDLSVGGRLRLGMNGGKNPTVFYQHKGATLTKSMLYSNAPYTFYIGYKSLAYFIMDDDVTLHYGSTSAKREVLAMGVSGGSGHLILNESAKLDPGGELRIGYNNNSANYVWMNGSSRITGKATINVGYANGSSGYMTLSNESAIVATGILNIGARKLGTEVSKLGTVDMWDSSAISAGKVNVGAGGLDGRLTLHDNSRLDGTAVLSIGTLGASTGRVVVTDNAYASLNSITVGVANASALGILTVTNGGQVVGGMINVAVDTGRAGIVEVCEGGLITNATIKICDYGNASGLLAMRGGRVLFNADATSYNPLRLYTPDRANGAVRGWGTVAFTDPRGMVTEASRASGFGMAHYGQIIADGEGEARDLDFSRFGVLCYDNTAPNTCGTNGWFAVNKGRLKLPRCLSRKSDSTICVGDYYGFDYSVESRYANSSNRLANTFSCVFTGAALNNFIFSELYATDREDIPAGLNAIGADRTISVWRIGLFTDGPEIDEPVSPDAFTSAKVHFRMPNDNLDDLALICVYRHDGTANGNWRLVGRTKVRKGWPVVPANVSAPSAANWNLGWFAVVGRKSPFGAMFTIR